MPIFTAEIADRPTVVFAAPDHAGAVAFVSHDFIRSELAALRTQEGVPLWDGVTDIIIRPSDADQRTTWERNLVEDLAAGVHESREDAVQSNGFAFLVDYWEPDE